jgi:hypothetical protein
MTPPRAGAVSRLPPVLAPACLFLLAWAAWGCSRPAGEPGERTGGRERTAAVAAGSAATPATAPPSGVHSPAPPPAPAVARAARSGRRVLFVGLDGADWQLLDGYMADGTMPHLAALVRQGRSGVLTTIHPPLSPLVWTTMMSGVSPLEHRVLDFTQLDPRSGERQPITSAERRVPAVWNMATWAGRSVAVFGLWATYPAEPVRGLLVADRFSSFTARDRQPPPGVVFPPEREPWARQVLHDAAETTGFDDLHVYFPWLGRGEYERLVGAPEPYAHPVSAMRQILIETRAYHRLAMEHLARARPDLAIVYFQGTDSIGHIFAPYAPPREPGVSAVDFAHYGGVPRAYFAAVDRLLGDFRALAEQTGAVLFIASDHGFYWGEGRPAQLASARAATAGRWHRDEGIYLLWGPGVTPAAAGLQPAPAPPSGVPSIHPPDSAPAAARPRASVAQVCATLLALLGLPPGKDLAGPPVPGTPPPPSPPASGAAAPPVLDYRAFFQPPTPSAAAPAGEDEKLAQLRALGYIGAAEPRTVRPLAPAPTPGAAADSAASPTRTAASFNNEGLLLRQLGRAAAARAAFEQALARDPGLASAQWNLSDLLFSTSLGGAGAAGARDRADDLLLRALAGGLPDGVERTLERAAAYGREGAATRGLALLDRAVAARPDQPRLWLLRGRYRLAAHLCDPALADFTRAEQLAPADPLAHASAGLARLCRGDEAGALAEFRRSLELDPNQPEIRRFLAPGGS